MGLKSSLEEWAIRIWLNKQVKEGNMFGKIWTALNGKKLVIGSVITVVASIVATLPVILPLFVQDTNVIAHAVGVGVTVLGLLHKVYKFIYKEDLAA